MDNASSRTVRVQTDVPSNWKTAISSAIAEWNALGYNISFGEVSASNNTNIIGQIDVVYYTYDLLAIPYADRNKVFASTLYPTANGNVGEVLGINKTLDINTSYNANAASARKSIIAHELGHALGLSHTDTMDYLAVSSATGCSGSATDANSIMRKTMLRNESWKAFTACDKAVINYYW
jgi:predicted Zn-dependent protease